MLRIVSAYFLTVRVRRTSTYSLFAKIRFIQKTAKTGKSDLLMTRFELIAIGVGPKKTVRYSSLAGSGLTLPSPKFQTIPRIQKYFLKILRLTQPWWLGGRAVAAHSVVSAVFYLSGFESCLSMVYRSVSSRKAMLQFPMQNAGSSSEGLQYMP